MKQLACHIHDRLSKEATVPVGLGSKNYPSKQALEEMSFLMVMGNCIEVVSSTVLNSNHSSRNPFPAPIKSVAKRLPSRLR
jgi:hypothetical protein